MAKKMTEREQFYYGKGYNKAIEEAADLARKPNKMEFFAASFGKKLGEEFDIKWGVCEYTIRFTKDGMEVTDDYGEWYEAQLYRVLLTGEAVIVDA